MSSTTETFQISPQQAEVYEARFVPALFAQWVPLLLDATATGEGHSVLDVACGTGILARGAVERVGPGGRVAGVDLNEGMLSVARRLQPAVEWFHGDAASLPFDDGTFDRVLCQSSLMFFPDATQALRDMGRVCRPGGTVGVQVYASLDDQPALGPWVDMVARHAGADAMRLLSTYWVHGDVDALCRRFDAARLDVTAVQTHTGFERWGSVDELVEVEVESTPLIDRISDAVYRRIREESRALLARYETDAGVASPITSHIVVARAT